VVKSSGILRSHLRCWGGAGEELLPEGRLGNRVEREVAADDGERFCVLLYAFLVEFLLREFAACEIAVRRIHLPQPSFVPPRTGADEDLPLGQSVDSCSKALPIEGRDAVEKIGLRGHRLSRALLRESKHGWPLRLRSTRVPNQEPQSRRC
jgi:hypothetical protein